VADVVVHDVERLAAFAGEVDRPERARHMVGLELRLLDVVGIRQLER
jgi:hypothetical protein